MDEPKWTERDLLFANTMLLRNLAAWLVVSGGMTAQKLDDIIQITRGHLEKEGDLGGARRALEATFGEHLMAQLLRAEQSRQA